MKTIEMHVRVIISPDYFTVSTTCAQCGHRSYTHDRKMFPEFALAQVIERFIGQHASHNEQ